MGLGALGAVLPVMPSTIFFILALWCFKRSSKRLEDWLLNHSVFGPTLRDWEESRSIKLMTKVVAIGLIWGCLAVSIWAASKTSVTSILLATGALLTLYLATRKTKAVA